MKNGSLSIDTPGTVSGVFLTKKDADAAYDALLKRGHTADDISVLMSDETLNSHMNPPLESDYVSEEEKTETQPGGIIGAIISITRMISLPGLGIAISNKLWARVNLSEEEKDRTVGGIIGSNIPEEHTDSYEESMKEGGIIISVDPKNFTEREAIIRDFKANNGHDILGDDGYTEED